MTMICLWKQSTILVLVILFKPEQPNLEYLKHLLNNSPVWQWNLTSIAQILLVFINKCLRIICGTFLSNTISLIQLCNLSNLELIQRQVKRRTSNGSHKDNEIGVAQETTWDEQYHKKYNQILLRGKTQKKCIFFKIHVLIWAAQLRQIYKNIFNITF